MPINEWIPIKSVQWRAWSPWAVPVGHLCDVAVHLRASCWGNFAGVPRRQDVCQEPAMETKACYLQTLELSRPAGADQQ